MLLLFAALLITPPNVTEAYPKPVALFGATSKPAALARTDAGVVGCWGEARTGGGSQVVCARMAADGRFETPVALPSAEPGHNDGVPAITWNGKDLVVVFEEEAFPNRVVMTRLDRDLHPLQTKAVEYAADPSPAVVRGPAPNIAWNGREAWRRASFLPRRFRGRARSAEEHTMFFLLASLLVTSPTVTEAYQKPLPVFGITSKAVALARTDAGVVGCWGEARMGGGSQVVCARMAADGRFETPVAIPPGTPGGNDAVPALGWNGKELLVAFEENGSPNRVVMTRLDRDLRPIETRVALYAADGGPAPAVAWNGTEWLVTVRQSATRFTSNLQVAGATAADTPIQDTVAVGGTFVLLTDPAVTTTTQTHCTVVYGFTICSQIPVTTSSWTGRLLPSDASFPLVGSPDRVSGTAAGAARSRDFFVAWPERDPAGGVNLYAAAYTASGAPVASYTVTTMPVPREDPHIAVAATDDGALVVWEESADIRGTLLDAGGKPKGEPFAIAAAAPDEQHDEQHPVALALGGGRYLVAYELVDHGLTRLATRFVLTAPVSRPRPIR